MMKNQNYKKELNDFTYIVSHDLNAPFRHVREFTKLLLHKIEDRIQEEEREYFNYIQTSVAKAEGMLNALLTYSRINTLAQKFKDIQLQHLLDRCMSDFQEELSSNNIHIELVNIPQSIRGDSDQILMLFNSLIDNAIKYRKQDGTQHHITITCADNPKNSDEWFFTIKDNGRGIEAKYIEQIFTIFKTAHFIEKLETIGAGLTIAQKIVWRHGGEIFIESQLNEGCTVTFTLNKMPIDESDDEIG